MKTKIKAQKRRNDIKYTKLEITHKEHNQKENTKK